MNTRRFLTNTVACISAAFLVASIVQAKEHEGMSKGHLMMKDGKMMVMKEGKTMQMQKEMTLSDGTKVMPDGTVMMKDGTKKAMKDGEAIGMDGAMMPSAKMKK